MVLDYSHLQADPPVVPSGSKRKHKIVKGHVVVRAPKDVRGVTMHQTACIFGVDKWLLKKFNGDRVAARNSRSSNIASHLVTFQDGTSIHNNPLLWYVWHGNGLNPFTFGHEIEAKVPGLGRGRLPRSLIVGACEGLTYLVEEGRKLGCPIEDLYAHRQSSWSRRADPGEELWDEVALKHGEQVLGLKLHTAWFMDDGRAIPREWDARSLDKY